MKLFLKKLAHPIKRHPLIYFLRYLLLSKNNHGKNIDNLGCFNNTNTVDAVPKLFLEINTKIKIDVNEDELDQAISIGAFLRSSIKGGVGIGLSSGKTLEKMLAGEGGVCSDFSQIFNVFCLINGILVKEWGSVDCLYKTKFGHSFNEIYSTKHQKWIAIDIHKGIIFEDTANHTFFSVVGLFNDLRQGNSLQVKHYSDYIPNKPERISMVYALKNIPFLIDNKESAIVDFYFTKYQNLMPNVIINALLVLLRKNQTFIFVLDDYKMKLLPKYFQNLKIS